MFPKPEIGLGILLGEGAQRVQHFFGQPITDLGNMPILLEPLARNIQRQVSGINHAFQKTEIARNKVFALLHDHDPLGVELEPKRRGMKREIKRGLRGQEDQSLKLKASLGPKIERLERRIPVVGNMLVELGIFVFCDLSRCPCPDGFHGVEGLVFHHNGRLCAFLGLTLIIPLDFFAFLLVLNRIGHKIGVPFHNTVQYPRVRKIFNPVFRVGRLELEGD